MFLFVCFTVVLRPTQGYFTYMETSPIAGEGLQILTYTRHLWPLSSEGSLTCHIYCDTGHRFLLSQSEGQETKPGAGGARTHNLTIESRARYQLTYLFQRNLDMLSQIDHGALI